MRYSAPIQGIIEVDNEGITIVAIRMGQGVESDNILEFKITDHVSYTLTQALFAMMMGKKFYAYLNGQRRELEYVDREDGSGSYVRTIADSTTSNNLLNLPRF